MPFFIIFFQNKRELRKIFDPYEPRKIEGLSEFIQAMRKAMHSLKVR